MRGRDPRIFLVAAESMSGKAPRPRCVGGATDAFGVLSVAPRMHFALKKSMPP